MLRFAFLFFIFGTSYANAIPATVDYIFDGDTFAAHIHVTNNIQIPARVRLMNIDTPEINGKCDFEIQAAKRAKARLADLIPVGTVVELAEIKDDKYLGRIDAYVFDSKNRDVGEILINENLGRKYNGGHRDGWCGKSNQKK